MSFQNPWTQSVAYHLGFGLLIFLISMSLPKPQVIESYQISIREKVNVAPLQQVPENLSVSQNKAALKKAKTEPDAFGLNNQTLTSSQNDLSEVKKGNTLTKEVDQLVSDGNALPVPVENFLVTRMPKVKKEIRSAYPAEAKALGIEGAVVVSLLIDERGVVREVMLVKGVGYGLDEVALAALRQYEFEPALIDDQAVPVQIRYTYKFILD